MGNKIGKTIGNQLSLKYVPNEGKHLSSIPLGKVDDLLVFDVYEGYRKIGRFKLADIRVKFR